MKFNPKTAIKNVAQQASSQAIAGIKSETKANLESVKTQTVGGILPGSAAEIQQDPTSPASDAATIGARRKDEVQSRRALSQLESEIEQLRKKREQTEEQRLASLNEALAPSDGASQPQVQIPDSASQAGKPNVAKNAELGKKKH